MKDSIYNYTFEDVLWWFVTGFIFGMLSIWASIYFGRHTSNDYREKFDSDGDYPFFEINEEDVDPVLK
jgi:hypothetical protein